MRLPPSSGLQTALLLTACPGFGDQTLEDLVGPNGSTPSWDVEIGPIIVSECGGCHTNPPTGGAPGGFRLDTYATDEQGDGLPGAFDRSDRIFARTVNIDPSPMPPGRALPEATRALIGSWITAGAPKAPVEGGE